MAVERVIEFRTTFLSDRGVEVLGKHALGLPEGHPARETIRLLIERYSRYGQVVTFGDARVEASAFDGLDDVMADAEGREPDLRALEEAA